ncbi:hypothetical protein F8M41_015913 [Gigaspora margarita]|uniref:Uncharacterized protein n=1 Tax=Gigaspora margarita TaxID=4874 RepID=A0A8H4EN14_GIGMA|nr:hypothetical protein F8M41_015913 [Gigaspora margarita]
MITMSNWFDGVQTIWDAMNNITFVGLAEPNGATNRANAMDTSFFISILYNHRTPLASSLTLHISYLLPSRYCVTIISLDNIVNKRTLLSAP